MVKSYLKYEISSTFGVVASSSSNTVWTPDSNSTSSTARKTGAGRAYVGANEEVLCWDVKKGELLSCWRDKDCTAEVTVITRSVTDPDVFAVGYADGSIRLWDSRIATAILSFNGHRSAVTNLAFDHTGVRLASGAKDTDIIIWDLVTERGLFKLQGHKGQITGLHFLHAPLDAVENGQENGESANADAIFLLSTSKDAMVKVWDVESQYCIETHITQSNGECWALAVSPEGNSCITAGNEGELTVWGLDAGRLFSQSSRLDRETDAQYLNNRGVIRRQGGDRTVGVVFHPTADYFAVHGSEKAVELWRIRNPQEVEKAMARKRRRKREKAAKDGDGDLDMQNGDDDAELTPEVSDVFVPHVIVRTGGKVRSADWAGGRASKSIPLLVSTNNNQLEVYHVSPHTSGKKKEKEDIEYNRSHVVDLPGHRTDIRATSLSSDDRMLATASNGLLKIWNVDTQACLRTLECGYALACSFLPGDKIVVVATKSGHLELFDIASSALLETIQAHDGAVWTLRVHPDGRSVITGSADKTVKFWSFEIISEDIPGTRRSTSRLTLKQKRVLKLNDDILALTISPDSRLLAVATLDNTVKVFFLDTLKLFLSLYGHKLPVLSVSISSDSKLIATCSADKNIRIWGLDFGDCHKAFFAHDDAIMSVSFIPHPPSREDAHILFSIAKDGLLKTWDATKFQHLQTLRSHHGEIWALSPSRDGAFVTTASHDRSIRIWRQSDEPLFLEEERERELEEQHDAHLAEALDKDLADAAALHPSSSSLDPGATVADVSKQTASTLTAGEKITAALDIASADLAAQRLYSTQGGPKPDRHPILAFRNQTAEAHLLGTLEAIPGPALQDALLLLSFSLLPQVFEFASIWLERGMNVPLACRVLFFLLQVHHRQIVASRELRGVLGRMQPVLRRALDEAKDVMGYNLAGVSVLSRRVVETRHRGFEEDEEDEVLVKGAASGRKRGFVSVA